MFQNGLCFHFIFILISFKIFFLFFLLKIRKSEDITLKLFLKYYIH